MIPVTADLALGDDEVEVRFHLAGGPGGQNVNKVATAASLRFDARRSPSLSNAVSVRLQRLAGRRLTRDGVLVISASRFRSQEANRRDAVERLVALIREALEPHKPRRATKPTAASTTRRLHAKARRAGVKSARGRPGPED